MPRTPPRARRLPILLAAIALAAPALAQDQPAPDREEPPAIRPTRPGQPKRRASIPGLEKTDRRIRPPALLREGSFVVRRRGSMIPLPSGERAFIFHKDDKGAAERPMVLIPSQTLQRMEQSAGEEPTIFSISGEVFAYRGVNYLLPTAAAIESAPPPPRDDPRPATPAPPEAEPAASPEVQDLIRRLEAQRDRPRTIDPALQSRPIASAPDAAAAPELIPEGRTIVRRRGRMVRTGSGDWSFVFDTGADDDPAKDRPLLMVPSLTLQAMEAAAMRDGDAASFEVSGRILSYNKRNYLIPSLFQTLARHDLQPRP